MPIRKIEFINSEIYHIVIRGVDGRKIFIDDEDCWRGIFGLYEFNTLKAVTIREQREKREKFKELLKQAARERDSGRFAQLEREADKRDRLVDILSFVFMPNHLHLLLRQIKQEGISLFIKKLSIGYAMYFNARHSRRGVLFQGRFDANHIDGNEYLKNVFTYIHTNPVSMAEPKWKENGIGNVKRAIEFLEEYRWSSYLDYIGVKNFPSVTERDFGLKIFAGMENDYANQGSLIMRNFVEHWLAAKDKLPESRSL